MEKADRILENHGIRPTSNRILVVRELSVSSNPLSLTDLETRIESLDKSSIFRVLTLLLEHHAVHTVEDGRGIVKYELCTGDTTDCASHMHVHFYCEKCHKVYCLDHTPTPPVNLPDGFTAKSVNYMIKGVCGDCRH